MAANNVGAGVKRDPTGPERRGRRKPSKQWLAEQAVRDMESIIGTLSIYRRGDESLAETQIRIVAERNEYLARLTGKIPKETQDFEED